jgi:hypothetical protein
MDLVVIYGQYNVKLKKEIVVDVVGNLQVHEYFAWWSLNYLHKANFMLSFFSKQKLLVRQLDLGDLPL